MTVRTVWTCLLTCGIVAPASAQEVQDILRSHCARCHDRQGVNNGGFDYLLDRDALVARRQVVPGQPASSELLRKIVQGEMPPKGPRPSKQEQAILEKWIAAGAPDWRPRPAPGLNDADAYRLIAADQQAVPEAERRHRRYFTLNHLAAAGWSATEIDAARLALAKLINSLSWHPRLAVPHSVDGRGWVYRIDLRDYKWSERLWDRLAAQYPYSPNPLTEPVKVLRVDWFIATASSAAFYYEALQAPAADKALERLLQVDVATNVSQGTARRAGFTDSGVSKNNRLLERHDAAFGAYWRSYDFSASTERQNLLNHPLGPPPARDSFLHQGGEMIYHLPNGMLAFFVTDDAGKRVQRARVEIVSDPQRPDKIVEAGVSCFTCPAKGFIPKADQVRAHVTGNAAAFAKEDVVAVETLYRPDAELRRLLDQDNERYHAALAKLGIKPTDADPIQQVRNRYEGLVDLKIAAAELGLSPDGLTSRLRKSEALQRSVGALLTPGGTVQRGTFLSALRELIESTPRGTTVSQPFAGHRDRVLCLTIAADGRRAASSSADRTIRIWHMATAEETQRLESPQPLQALAFSPEGRQLLAGGDDRLLHLYDLKTGTATRTFRGHVDVIRAVALSPDGQHAASAGLDRTIRVWDIDSGKELTRIAALDGPIATVAFSPDGRSVLAPVGRSVRCWDSRSGEELRRFPGHTAEVYAAAFSPDGKRIVSGGNDKTVRVWDASTGQELLVLKGHVNAVIAVAFTADGQRLLSASSQYQQADQTLRVWDAATGKELRAQGGVDVRGAAFAADGSAALTIGIDVPIRLWRLTPASRER
jgi:WD40 repeat protein